MGGRARSEGGAEVNPGGGSSTARAGPGSSRRAEVAGCVAGWGRGGRLHRRWGDGGQREPEVEDACSAGELEVEDKDKLRGKRRKKNKEEGKRKNNNRKEKRKVKKEIEKENGRVLWTYHHLIHLTQSRISVLPNIFLKWFQIHQKICFTSTITVRGVLNTP